MAGGLANVCKNHQPRLRVLVFTCARYLFRNSNQPRARTVQPFFTSQKILITLARATAPKTIRLASFQLTLYGKADEFRPVPVALIAACLHQSINGVHDLGFH